MLRDNERHKHFNRRAAILGGGKALLLSILAGRLYYLQVVEADRYRTLADENRINLRLLPPLRGRIVDRLGIPLADNQQNYRVLLIPEDARSLHATMNALDQVIPLSDGERRRILRDVKRNRSFVPVTVRENLSWKSAAQIEVNSPDLPGIMIDVGQSRSYPHGQELAHVMGYVAAVSPAEQTGDPLLELPGFRVGKAGLEKIHDLRLRGKSGSSQVEVNAYGRVIRELERREGEPGAEVNLTIDIALQRTVNHRLKNQSAAAVAIDVHSGEVLAMASSPAFDPNAFNQGLKVADWQALINNPRAPLINKAIAGRYAPGSTFKMIVLLAALERGVVNTSTQFFCNSFINLGDARFHCWSKHGHGFVNANDAISQSCDVYFYEIAKRTGIERIASMAKRFGLGSPLGIDLPGELAGLVPTPKWKRQAYEAAWQKGETVITGIGQGYLLATPLQLSVMTARMVNGGFAVTPRLTRDVSGLKSGDSENEQKFKSLGIPTRHLDIVRAAMGDVVNSPTGTARGSRIEEPEWKMGGKTGTVQVRRISKSEREQGVVKNQDLPWKERDHAIFVGYAPMENPRYAVSVVVEHGGSGSKTAAPIARDILLEAQRRRSSQSTVARVVGSLETIQKKRDN
ncbi:MAG: penicillin-binding protein 2 [Rhodospirillaceae bacterium TMED8]|nr:penicillin-binding protein 2 [Magnetovibrio sp.]OUT48929.1 MAG: penicillin-binding protein 2 [Rhodospirillaceae bacterium TMED8]|tara:strand:- start:1507 stop:3396 length:1890 start_codon:yes stop_codon:yes gene_type:complete